MITQTIKRWLHKMFAWWPWRRSPETEFTRTLGSANTGATQEPVLRTTMDGFTPLPGVASVIVEQAGSGTSPDMSRPTTEERPERVIPSPPPVIEENPASPPVSPPAVPVETAKETPKPTRDVPATVPPTQEQLLEFLRYLVKRGIVNEGFAEGQVPEQYKRK